MGTLRISLLKYVNNIKEIVETNILTFFVNGFITYLNYLECC